MLSRTMLLLIVSVSVGCGGATPEATTTPSAPAAASSPEHGTGEGEFAATPFTAEQIRDATKAGRVYRFRQEGEGEPVREHRVEFVAVDPEGCTIRTTNLGPDGQPASPPDESHASWAELQHHAQFPRSATTITRETIEVPAGRFDAILYTLESRVAGHHVAQRYWFATSLPGAPVRVTHERDGTVVMSMTLLEHRSP
jgi:hypothetical protein